MFAFMYNIDVYISDLILFLKLIKSLGMSHSFHSRFFLLFLCACQCLVYFISFSIGHLLRSVCSRLFTKVSYFHSLCNHHMYNVLLYFS